MNTLKEFGEHPALNFETGCHEWQERTWDAPDATESTPPAFRGLHLYDGGVFDNIGLEPFFDVGRQMLKQEGVLRDQL